MLFDGGFSSVRVGDVRGCLRGMERKDRERLFLRCLSRIIGTILFILLCDYLE